MTTGYQQFPGELYRRLSIDSELVMTVTRRGAVLGFPSATLIVSNGLSPIRKDPRVLCFV